MMSGILTNAPIWCRVFVRKGCMRSLEESMGTLFAIPFHCTKQFVFKADQF